MQFAVNPQETAISKTVHPIRTQDIHSLSDFQRKTRKHVERLRESGRPEVLTINGKASLVVQDADAYQRLLELADRMDTLLAVKAGLESTRRDEGISLEQFDREMRSKHGIPDSRGATGTEGH